MGAVTLLLFLLISMSRLTISISRTFTDFTHGNTINHTDKLSTTFAMVQTRRDGLDIWSYRKNKTVMKIIVSTLAWNRQEKVLVTCQFWDVAITQISCSDWLCEFWEWKSIDWKFLKLVNRMMLIRFACMRLILDLLHEMLIIFACMRLILDLLHLKLKFAML